MSVNEILDTGGADDSRVLIQASNKSLPQPSHATYSVEITIQYNNSVFCSVDQGAMCRNAFVFKEKVSTEYQDNELLFCSKIN